MSSVFTLQYLGCISASRQRPSVAAACSSAVGCGMQRHSQFRYRHTAAPPSMRWLAGSLWGAARTEVLAHALRLRVVTLHREAGMRAAANFKQLHSPRWRPPEGRGGRACQVATEPKAKAAGSCWEAECFIGGRLVCGNSNPSTGACHAPFPSLQHPV